MAWVFDFLWCCKRGSGIGVRDGGGLALGAANEAVHACLRRCMQRPTVAGVGVDSRAASLKGLRSYRGSAAFGRRRPFVKLHTPFARPLLFLWTHAACF